MKANWFYILVCSLMFCFFCASAQTFEKCCSNIPSEQWEKEIGRLIREKKLHHQKANGKQNPVYTIPVMVHVIHGGEPIGTYPNISQAQIESQIRVLNEEMAGIGKNSGSYPAQAFTNFAALSNIPSINLDSWGRVKIADCQIQFCLAKYDTLGNLLAEPGIKRVDYHSYNWMDPASFSTVNPWINNIKTVIKPATIWNVSKYLNVWISDKNNSINVAGFATFPPFTGLSGLQSAIGTNLDDGVWAYTKVFGSTQYYPNGTYSTSNNLGKVMVHEVGHYFGLRHIWGDGFCQPDYCSDTPDALASNSGNPAYPLNVNSCSNNPDGEMFMNYMDYTSQQSTYMFTPDQALRMQAALFSSPYRNLLGTHGLCTVKPVASTASFTLINSVCGSSAVVFPVNFSTGTPPPTYTWSVNGGGLIGPNPNSPFISISLPSSGVYTISLTTDNGTLSSTSKVFSVNPFPTINVTGVPTIPCFGSVISLTATGANWFSWQPAGIVANTYSYVANTTISFTVTGTGSGNCKGDTVISISPQLCTGLPQVSLTEKEIEVYPNPSSTTLSLSSERSAILEIRVEDVAGKVLYDITRNNTNKVVIDIDQWDAGIYIITLRSDNGKIVSHRIIKE